MCVSLVIGAILSMIAPNIEKNKVLKVILSAFILTGLISPLSSIVSNSDFIENINYTEAAKYESYKYDETALKNLEETASISLHPIIMSELSNLGVNDNFGLKLNFDIEKEGVKIESVNISIWDLHSIEKDKLQADLTKKTGLPINIVANESEDSQNVW